MRKRTAISGFTLIELLTVIAIIAILASILVPSVASTREKGRIAYCMANLSQIGKALNLYADANKDYLPHMRRLGSSTHTNWATRILEYMNKEPKAFLCPGDTVPGVGSRRTYAANGCATLDGIGTTYVCPFSNRDERQPMRLSDLDYNKGDIILISERPGVSGSNRGLMNNDWYTTLNAGQWYSSNPTEVALLPHQRTKSCNYLMASMAVKTMKVADVRARGETGTNNLFTVVR